MSLKTFIKKIANFIANFFNSLKKELQQAIQYGVEFVENVKNFDTNNPEVADILTAIIPGHWDDDLKAKIRTALPVILVQLRLLDATKNLTDEKEIVAAAIKFIQQLEGDYKSAALHDLSIIVAQVAADGKLDWKDAVYLLQYYYDHKLKS